MTRKEQIERLEQVLVTYRKWLAERIVDALAQPVEGNDVSLVDAATWAAAEVLKREGASPLPGNPVEWFGERVGVQKTRLVEITDEMVQRSYRAFLGQRAAYVPNRVGLRNMRVALHAALDGETYKSTTQTKEMKMRSPKIRSADELLAGSSAICPASSIEHGHRRYGLVQISLPVTRVTAADARRIAKALKVAARRTETTFRSERREGTQG